MWIKVEGWRFEGEGFSENEKISAVLLTDNCGESQIKLLHVYSQLILANLLRISFMTVQDQSVSSHMRV